MPLEATMVIIDNSEYMRNGDYVPTRLDAQGDAVNIVTTTKIDSNPENTVGVMTMAGKAPEVLVTHAKDVGQILGGLHAASSKISGSIDIPTAIAVAQLALKHRENKNLRQRIIVFVGSPLDAPGSDEKSMVKLAKKLKKNNVAVDIISFGDGIEEPDAEGKTVLKSFVDNVTNGDNSHLLTVQPGANLLSDAIISSPILSEDRRAGIPEELGGTGGAGGGAAAGPSTTNEFDFGVDPTLDPELAMALRLSMQEAQAREAAEAAASAPPQTTTTAPPAAPPPASNPPGPATTIPADATDAEDERLLQEALALSEKPDEDVDMDDEEEEEDDDEEEEDEEEEDEDAAIARAIEMSMRDQEEEGEGKKKK